MFSIIIGFLLLLVGVWMVLPVPWSVSWFDELFLFLKGGLPIIALFFGLLFFLVGIMITRDRKSAKKDLEDMEKEK